MTFYFFVKTNRTLQSRFSLKPISYSRRVEVNSSTSNAKRSKSPPLYCQINIAGLFKSPHAREPNKITLLASYFRAISRISSTTFCFIPVSFNYLKKGVSIL